LNVVNIGNFRAPPWIMVYPYDLNSC